MTKLKSATNDRPAMLQRLTASTLVAFTFVIHLRAEDTKPVAPQTPSIAIVEPQRAGPIDFEKEILPVLKNNCLACHNQTKAKADLVLENPQTILKGGESGPAVVPGKSPESLLLKVASHQEKPSMPPKDNKVNALDLTPEQLGLIKLWIDQGAQGEVRAAAPLEWRPLPENVNPIYAVALTADGQFAACSRANQIFVYHIPSGRLAQELTDTTLMVDGQGRSALSTNSQPLNNARIAHLDLVHSLAFSPDGTLLASGGYREVKLWRRPRNVQRSHLAFAEMRAAKAMAASPDARWFAAADGDGRVRLWEAGTGKEARLLPLANADAGAARAAICLKFSPNSTRLGSVTADKIVRVWNVVSGELLAETNYAAQMAAPDQPTAAPRAGEPEEKSVLCPLAWLSGDKQIAIGDPDKVIRIWQLGEEPHGQIKLVGNKRQNTAVTCLETVRNAENEILAGGADGYVRIWNVKTGEMIRELNHGGAITALACRSDGKCFASAGFNQAAKLWNAEDGKILAEIKGDRYAQEFLAETERNLTVANNAVAYRKTEVDGTEKQQKSAAERLSKANETFAAADKAYGEKQKQLQGAGESKTLAEKNLADLEAELKRVTENYQAADKTAKQAAEEAKAALDKATQAKLLADQSAQTKLDTERIAADAAGVASKSKSAAGANLPDSVKSAAERMAADAAGVAEKARAFAESAAVDATAKLKLAAEAKSAAEKAIDEVAAKSFAVGQMKPLFDKVTSETPEKTKQANEKLAAATNALVAAEKDFKKAEQTKSIADHEVQLAKSAAQQAMDAVGQAKTALATAETGQKKAETEVQNAKSEATNSEKIIRTIAFSPDNLVMATAGDDGKVHTWSAETGAAFEVFGATEKESSATGNSKTVFLTAFMSTNSVLAASQEKGMMTWELNPAWTLERTLGTGASDSLLLDRVHAARFSPDGKWLATGGGEPSRSGEILLWNTADGKLEKEFRNIHSDTVLALDFSPDGKYLASGAADKFVRVLELAGGKAVKSFEGHLHHVLGVSWKRDGRTLASSGADNVVKVWDFVSGERKKNIEGFSKEVTSVTFLDATDQALATSGDNQVRLVRENGESVRTFSGATDYVYSAMPTPDGKIVVAGGQDSTLRVWNGRDGKMMVNFPAPEAK